MQLDEINEPAAASWPEIGSATKPWTRWWWLGSAVDEENITQLLEAYCEAGIGGVEITPIYGAQGEELRDIPFLSDKWIAMLRHTVREAQRLGMGVDMPTGTGWPFGGSQVTDELAEDKLVVEALRVRTKRLSLPTDGSKPQAITAYSESGETLLLTDFLRGDGKLDWTPPDDQSWTVFVASQKFAGRMVKRAAPGGEGKCINPFSKKSLDQYLTRFDTALADLPPGAIRCQFHDSFEYLADWSPDLFCEFARRRGYDLRLHLDVLAKNCPDTDRSVRVLTDYRETISDLLLENFTQSWTNWAHAKGSMSRDQAHGSPGNLLDLYATPDIPETEIFGAVADPRVHKFASSAAHVAGRQLTSSETGTWFDEHFNVTLAQCKAAIDLLFASGINHIFYHGTAYSPSDAKWPGWLFYASTTFAPQDPLWHDFGTLNSYVARCQSILQAGYPG